MHAQLINIFGIISKQLRAVYFSNIFPQKPRRKHTDKQQICYYFVFLLSTSDFTYRDERIQAQYRNVSTLKTDSRARVENIYTRPNKDHILINISAMGTGTLHIGASVGNAEAPGSLQIPQPRLAEVAPVR